MSCWTVNVKGKPKKNNFHTHAAAVGDSIYVFDHFKNSEENPTSIGPLDVQVFRTDTYNWSVLKNENVSLINKFLPRSLYWQAIVVYKDLVYLFACINGHRVDVFLCYDTGSNLWSEPVVTGIMPPADIHGHSICVVNDAIYTFGGFGRRNVSLYGKEVYKLDLKSLKWSHITTTGQPPICRFGHSTTAIKSSIFIFGGVGYGGVYLDDVTSLDTQTMSWVTHEVGGYRPVARYAHSAVCHKGSLLVFGGGVTSEEIEEVNYFVRYDPDSRCWSRVETKGIGPCPRYGHSCVLIQDRVFVFSGVFTHPWPFSPDYPDLLNNVHACDFAPSLKTMSIVAVLEHNLDQKGLPETIRSDIKLTNPENYQSGNNNE